MNYGLRLLRRAQKELGRLDRRDLDLVAGEIRSLAAEPRPVGCRKLVGRDGWRIRAGDYRVLYEIDDREKQVTVLHVGHRRDVYR